MDSDEDRGESSKVGVDWSGTDNKDKKMIYTNAFKQINKSKCESACSRS